jgi:hypothetical protein
LWHYPFDTITKDMIDQAAQNEPKAWKDLFIGHSLNGAEFCEALKQMIQVKLMAV